MHEAGANEMALDVARDLEHHLGEVETLASRLMGLIRLCKYDWWALVVSQY